MNNIQVRIKKFHPKIKLPTYAHFDDAGMDLYSIDDFEILPGDRKVCPLGFALEIPNGFVGLVWDKGSTSVNHGIHTLAGVYDSGYRGEYNVVLVNLSDKLFKVERGDKIAQLLIQPVYRAEFEEVSELSQTLRGDGKLGSTGKK